MNLDDSSGFLFFYDIGVSYITLRIGVENDDFPADAELA